MNSGVTSEAQSSRVAEAFNAVRGRWAGEPRVALILGTGLGSLADHIDAEAVIPYRQIPNFPHSTALSHKSLLVCGRLQGVPVVAMQGRCHLYEGHPVSRLALPVRAMRALGAEVLVVSNASGGVNPNYRAGDIMVLEDHINLMWTSPLDEPAGHAARHGTGHAWGRSPRPAAYDEGLIERALQVARRESFVAHRGVYVGVTGPSYETRAEYRMFRRLGGDVVGMSTVPEVAAAAQGKMRVLALSLVTNVAKPDAPEVVDAEEVVRAASRAAPNMRQIVADTVRQFAAS